MDLEAKAWHDPVALVAATLGLTACGSGESGGNTAVGGLDDSRLSNGAQSGDRTSGVPVGSDIAIYEAALEDIEPVALKIQVATAPGAVTTYADETFNRFECELSFISSTSTADALPGEKASLPSQELGERLQWGLPGGAAVEVTAAITAGAPDPGPFSTLFKQRKRRGF